MPPEFKSKDVRFELTDEGRDPAEAHQEFHRRIEEPSLRRLAECFTVLAEISEERAERMARKVGESLSGEEKEIET